MSTELLPKVREGTYNAIIQSIADYESDATFIVEMMERLKTTNPYVGLMIKHWTEDLEDEEFLRNIVGLCVLYRLLENEAEARIFEQEMEQSDA